MKPISHRLLLVIVLALGLSHGLPAAETASSADVKRITDRYTLTRTRISALLTDRLNPPPLPANPPNPFYQPAPLAPEDPAAAQGETPESALIPEASDLSDSDTLRKYAATLKIGGVITRNGVLHLTINNTTCKVGDIVTVGNKDRPHYLKLTSLSLSDFTLGLNEASLLVTLKK